MIDIDKCMVCFLISLLFFMIFGIWRQIRYENHKGDPCTQTLKAIDTLKNLEKWNEKDVLKTGNRDEAEKALTTIFVFLKLTKTMNSIAKTCDEVLTRWK